VFLSVSTKVAGAAPINLDVLFRTVEAKIGVLPSYNCEQSIFESWLRQGQAS